MLSHWKSLRGDEGVPLWEAFDPLDILETLERCAIVEFVDPDFIRIRLFGNALVARMGADHTGKNFLDLYEPEQRPGIKERTELLRTRPAVLCSIIASPSPMGVPLLAESMLFPFCEADGLIRRGLLSLHELGADSLAGLVPPKSVKGIELLQFDVIDL